MTRKSSILEESKLFLNSTPSPLGILEEILKEGNKNRLNCDYKKNSNKKWQNTWLKLKTINLNKGLGQQNVVKCKIILTKTNIKMKYLVYFFFFKNCFV